MAKARRRYAYAFTDGEKPAQDSRGNENKAFIFTNAKIRSGIGKHTVVWRREICGLNDLGDWAKFKTFEAQEKTSHV